MGDLKSPFVFMKINKTPILLISMLSLFMVPSSLDGDFKIAEAGTASADILFSHGTIGVDKYYNYCPSIMQEEDGTRHIYYCTNKVAGNVTDYIGYRKGVLQNGSYTWSEETIVLSPSSSGWDSRHNCDPSVIKGVFNYNNHEYHYLMAYLGCLTSDSSHNEVGIAVSDYPQSGWTKVESINPICHFVGTTGYSGWEWGYGQPSIISVDKLGQILLTYTTGERDGTYVRVEKWDFSNLNAPIKLAENAHLFVNGLTDINKSADYVLNNVDFAYDEASGRIYGIRDSHPNSSNNPEVATEIQLISLSKNLSDSSVGGNLLSSSGSWVVVDNIGVSKTGLERNHNAGLIRDEYGHLNNPLSLEIILTGASESSTTWGALSTYRLYSYQVGIFNSENDHYIDVSANITYNFTNPDQLSTFRIMPDKGDFSSGNAVAIRIRNNTGVDTPIWMAFNSTSDYRYRVINNTDSSKQYYLFSKNGEVNAYAYRTWDGDVWLKPYFDGWLVMNKDDQITDPSYANQGTFSWSSIYAIYFGIQTYYDSYANYDVGDIYMVNNFGTSFVFIDPVLQVGLTTNERTTQRFILDYMGSGAINITRNNISYIPVVGLIDKIEYADSCSASYADGYHSYSKILPYYNAVKDDAVFMNYFNTSYIYDYSPIDTTHSQGKNTLYLASYKWNLIIERHTNKTYGSNHLLPISENSFVTGLIILNISFGLFAFLIIIKTRKKKHG